MVPSVALFAALALIGSSAAHASIEPDKTPVVFVRKADPTEMFDVLTYPARVVARVNANVLSESDGIVAQIIAPLGRSVTRRSRLMIVKNTDPVYQYAPVVITAPVTGVVSQVEVSEGSRVVKGQRLATVTDPSQTRINVEVAAQDLSSIRSGMKAQLKISGRDGAPAQIEVLGVSPFVDPATGTATCELALVSPTAYKGPLPPAPVPQLSPGQVGQVTFTVNSRQGISIPEYAVVYRGNETFVKIVQQGKAKLVSVSLGRRQKGSIEILRGLAPGSEVIERSSGFVGDGEAVKVESGA